MHRWEKNELCSWVNSVLLYIGFLNVPVLTPMVCTNCTTLAFWRTLMFVIYLFNVEQFGLSNKALCKGNLYVIARVQFLNNAFSIYVRWVARQRQIGLILTAFLRSIKTSFHSHGNNPILFFTLLMLGIRSSRRIRNFPLNCTTCSC